MKLINDCEIKYKIIENNHIIREYYLKVSTKKIFGIRIWIYVKHIVTETTHDFGIPYPTLTDLCLTIFDADRNKLYDFIKLYDTTEKFLDYYLRTNLEYKEQLIDYKTTLAEKKKEFKLI